MRVRDHPVTPGNNTAATRGTTGSLPALCNYGTTMGGECHQTPAPVSSDTSGPHYQHARLVERQEPS